MSQNRSAGCRGWALNPGPSTLGGLHLGGDSFFMEIDFFRRGWSAAAGQVVVHRGGLLSTRCRAKTFRTRNRRRLRVGEQAMTCRLLSEFLSLSLSSCPRVLPVDRRVALLLGSTGASKQATDERWRLSGDSNQAASSQPAGRRACWPVIALRVCHVCVWQARDEETLTAVAGKQLLKTTRRRPTDVSKLVSAYDKCRDWTAAKLRCNNSHQYTNTHLLR